MFRSQFCDSNSLAGSILHFEEIWVNILTKWGPKFCENDGKKIKKIKMSNFLKINQILSGAESHREFNGAIRFVLRHKVRSQIR